MLETPVTSIKKRSDPRLNPLCGAEPIRLFFLYLSYRMSALSHLVARLLIRVRRTSIGKKALASSAGHGEKEVRRKIIETGDVDVMVSLRSNFFYTRSVPCELWFFDRSKSPLPQREAGVEGGALNHRDKVLMLDARNIYRRVTRKIYDFSPEQMQNLAAIVWLYRGQRERFLRLMKDYLGRLCAESASIPATLATFDATLADLRGRFDALAKAVAKHTDLDAEKKQALADAMTELCEAATLYEADATKLLASLHAFGQKYAKALVRQEPRSAHGAQGI